MRVLYIWNILENKIKEAILLWDKWYYTYVCNGLKHNFLASNRATPHQRNILMCNAIFKYTLMQCSIQLTSCPFVHSAGCIPQIYGIAGECNTLASLNHPNIIGCLGFLWFQHKNNIRHETCECIHWFTVKNKTSRIASCYIQSKMWISRESHWRFATPTAQLNEFFTRVNTLAGEEDPSIFAFIASKDSAKL